MNKENVKKEKKELLTQEQMQAILNSCYQKAVSGIPHVSPSIDELAEEYLQKYSTPEEAAKQMLKNQITKCTTSGFITGLGGAITLPVAIPANISSVLYVQMRMIAAMAYMVGLDLKSDHVQTLSYACLAGVSVNGVVKKAGVAAGQKLTTSMIQKIPGAVCVKINQAVGFRFITKFGQKGIINLGKMVPVVGGAISGGFDFAETRAIANRAYKMFFEGDFASGFTSDAQDDDCIDVDFEDVDIEK